MVIPVADYVPRPFLKWAGGKTQLLDELMTRIPAAFGRYHEPFVGSGALFFALHRAGRVRHASLSDLNKELVDTYIAIRERVGDIIELLSRYPHDEEFYYTLRSKDPWTMDLVQRAARMIYLNKTGYNGLYRVNKQGKFNVPFGRYKSPKYCDEENLRAVSAALQDVNVACAEFDQVLSMAAAGDLVYFDPPYVPLSQTASFTAYHANGFSSADQTRLRNVCIELSEIGAYVLLSNSDTELIRSLYNPQYFTISKVEANRAINCVGGKRGKITELIVTNYKPHEGA